MNAFVTGTDTDVGKTFFTSRFVQALRAAGHDAVGMKPICCGSNEDTSQLLRASGNAVSRADLNPVHLETPASPLTACEIEGRSVDLEEILAAHRRLTARHKFVVVEGAGGWLVPIRPDYTMADLARAMGVPVILVIENKLGALNHTLLTLESIARTGLPCAGLVFNHRNGRQDIAAQTNRRMLERLTRVPILCELHPDQDTIDLDNFTS